MEGIYLYLYFKSFYDIIAIILSILIVFNFSMSTLYGIKMIKIKVDNRYGWCPEMMVTIESGGWIIIFSYILINTLFGRQLVINNSFGAVFIRPMILLTSFITWILQKRRYINAVNKYKVEEFKNKLEQEE